MLALDKKLWRELWNMRMQAIAVAMVVVGGVSIFIMSLSMLDSLFQTRATYYRDNHFAQMFTGLKRAPYSLVKQIQAIPGVDTVDTRVVAYVNLDVEGFTYPISAHIVSLPANSRGRLNQVYLFTGRLLEPGRDDEILVSKKFAEAHRLDIGDSLRATINGRRKKLTIVGIAMSPEYIYQIAPGAIFPDFKRYGILWMARKPLATAYNMDGAFNDLSMTLVKGTNPETVIDRLDDLLKPYGGLGAYARKDQLSNRFLSEELKQLKNMATLFPLIFFAVAVFLLNVVISRLISLQREQISALKAFGYSNFAVGLHYSKLVLMIISLGIIVGIICGVWMGKGMSIIYTDFYSFPYMLYTLKPKVILAAISISVVLAVAGTLHAVSKAARLPPAEGMRPEPPAIYHATIIERLGLQRFFSQPSRMILRHIERQPFKSFLTMLGIAMACGIMMIGGYQADSIDYMVQVQYGMSQRQDLMATFTDPVSNEALYSLSHIPGVRRVEGFRSVPTRLKFEHRFYRTSVDGIEPHGSLVRLLDTNLDVVKLPEEGVVLTDYLAELLHISVGDMLTIEILEGNRPVFEAPVVATTKQYLGVNAYMQREALNRLLKEGNAISGAYIAVDKPRMHDVYKRLKEMPRIAGVVEQASAIQAFYDTLAETVLFFTFISTLLGASISFGVIYNSMRIALSERNRELASMRVLGFTRGEVAYILLGELGLLTIAAIPIGLLFGYGLCGFLSYQFDSDLYRIPLVLNPSVYAFAALVVIISSLVSGLMIWRNIAQLDMVAVLKTKE